MKHMYYLLTLLCLTINIATIEVKISYDEYIKLKKQYIELKQKILNLSARNSVGLSTQYANLDKEIDKFCETSKSYNSQTLKEWCTNLHNQRK
ncbi:MAG: hypothetical protein WC707_04005 [Candidatus Babeliaceae bacterium]|jgi:hypothetical protein